MLLYYTDIVMCIVTVECERLTYNTTGNAVNFSIVPSADKLPISSALFGALMTN